MINTNIELYIPELQSQDGGEARDIWPIITDNWKQHYSLGIKSIESDILNFKIIPNNIDKNDEPILGRGAFTAVYKVKNVKYPDDNTEYIFRLYLRDEKLSSQHMMYEQKIITEYNRYNEYLPKIFYYGELHINYYKYRYIDGKYPSNDSYKINKNQPTTFNFDYVISKIYNVATFDKMNYVSGLTNLQKFTFLHNNLIMLNKLTDNNTFHGDYKITNVGWENSTKMDVILIDYDVDTIQVCDNSNIKFKLRSNGDATGFLFASTYLPQYLKNGNKLKTIPESKYIKYSVGGLVEIIDVLNIQFTIDFINLPSKLHYKKIKNLNLNKLSDTLYLNSDNYDEIPMYNEIINILMYLYECKLVK